MRNQKTQCTKNRQDVPQIQTQAIKSQKQTKQSKYESINTENTQIPNKSSSFRYQRQYGQDNWPIGRIWFWQYVTYSFDLWKNITRKNGHISLEHLPKISEDESIQEPLRKTKIAIHQYQQQKSKINNIDLIKIIFTKSLKYNVCMAILNFFIQGILKCAISIFISIFLNLVIDGELNNAYLTALLLTVLNLFSIICCNHGFTQSERFSCRCRMLIINVVYQKLLHLTPYSIKEANVGRILNLISGDIAILESLLSLLLQALVAPVTALIAAGILWAQFGGPIGLLAIAIIFLAYPMQLLINRFNMPTIWKSKMCSDTRLKLTNELIDGIRLIKMYAWENAFEKMITNVRSNENMNYIMIQIRTGLDRTFSLTSQLWGSLIFFLILQYGGFADVLNVPDMIATIQLLSYIKFACVYFVSLGILAMTMVRISFERIANIINLQNYEMKPLDPITDDKESEYGIELQNFSAFWKGVVEDQTKPVLKNINLQIKEGELWAIVGRVGSGKSTLLNALLLEIPSYKGSLKVYGKEAKRENMNAAYVEQEPFIFPDSVKKNILFGREFDNELYQKVCEASCLNDDISQMKYRDETEIGEKGINLSGGQKARLSLARALYQVADIYLFDDPLSAVDAKVAQQIFSKAIKEFIFQKQSQFSKSTKKPIVVLITHQIQYAIECDNIAILDEGSLISQGNYEQVKNSLTMISEELSKQFQESKEAEKNLQNKIQIDIQGEEQQEDLQDDEEQIEEKQQIKEHNLIGREEEQRTAVTIHTLQRYFKYWNKIVLIILVLQNIISEVLFNLYFRLVSIYDEFQQQNDVDSGQLLMGMLILGFLINNFVKYTLNTIMIQSTSKQIHQEMLQSIMQAPTSYFDTNPTGRIINKFSNDLSLADNQTTIVLLDIQEILFNFVISLITLVILQPYFIILIVFILCADFFLFFANKNQMLQLKELELMRKSPIFDFLKKTIDGVTQMRIYKKEKWFEEQYFELSQQSVMSACAYYYAGRVLTFYMDMTGWIVQLVGIFMTLKLDSEDQGIISQVILMLIIFNDAINWALRQMIIFETQLTSYNRMFNTIDIKSEAPHNMQGDEKIEFPKTGDISMKNVYMRYRENCDLVLKGLTLSIKEGEKIGCVGRTGAGKSSILQILFRMVEIEKREDSQLEIGNQDIRVLGLNKLRSNLAIIPQTPFLFTGSIRRNLDPFSLQQDEELWKALEQTDLRNYVESLDKKLDTDMSDVNSVFSVGQKQLICLARVLLNKRKIIVLDEATANVDMITDDFIQQTIKQMFQDCTIITIAHRLNTIADYDRVIVMKDGQVAEFDSPYRLLQDKESEFSKMVASTGEYNANAIIKIATNNHNKC